MTLVAPHHASPSDSSYGWVSAGSEALSACQAAATPSDQGNSYGRSREGHV